MASQRNLSLHVQSSRLSLPSAVNLADIIHRAGSPLFHPEGDFSSHDVHTEGTGKKKNRVCAKPQKSKDPNISVKFFFFSVPAVNLVNRQSGQKRKKKMPRGSQTP